MSERKLGVWIIGALGTISATVITGAALLRKGLIAPTGMLTSTAMFKGLDLIPIENLDFGGCDIREGTLHESIRQLAEGTGAIPLEIAGTVKGDLDQVECELKRGTCRNCGEAIESMAASAAHSRKSIRGEIEDLRKNLRDFKLLKNLERVVVVNLASTEPPLALSELHHEPELFERSLDANELSSVRASTLYAYAAIREGCPYLNFTPSTGALIPALLQLAEQNRVPLMGNDGKTGETLVKSALAPMFLWRNLEVLSWEGFNILGNMDGCILRNPENKESKLRTKDQVLSRILGYSPHSRVHIDYVPSLNDQKTAWDFIHFKGFMGAKMSLQFIWQGYDSLLAAPLVLDLVRLTELACRRGEYGLMPQLASYFKAPLGVETHALYDQFQMLSDYVNMVEEEKH